MIRFWLIALLLVLFGNEVAYADLIVNGSFESPGFSHSSNADNYRYLADSGDSSITGWTISRAQSVGEQVYWFHSSRYQTFHGEYALYLSDGGNASTIVTVEANQPYALSFNAVTSAVMNVSIGSLSKDLRDLEATNTGTPGWVRYTLVFTPTTSGTQQLDLFNIPNGIVLGGGVTIDGVSITAVPEPSSCVSVILAGLLALRTRIRQRTR